MAIDAEANETRGRARDERTLNLAESNNESLVMRKLLLLGLSALLVVGTQSTKAETSTVSSAEGASLSVRVDLPAGDGKVPAIVLAPGQGYHMNLPAMDATARALVEQGVAVFRFNWAYFTAEPKGQPSPDLSKELKDLQAVLAAARKHPRVAEQSVSVGGKSLGSLVAWRAFAADPKLRSALLLTPVCSRVPKGETVPRPEAQENYPGFDAEQRPSLWISGNADPLCSPSVLYKFAALRPEAARIAIVGGDHSYENRELPQPALDAARNRSLAAVSALSAGFVSEMAVARP